MKVPTLVCHLNDCVVFVGKTKVQVGSLSFQSIVI